MTMVIKQKTMLKKEEATKKKEKSRSSDTSPSVTIYSTPTCPYCTMAKNFLREHQITFFDINVADDQKAAHEMIEKSGQTGVPVIDIDGTIVIGFDQEQVKKLLHLKK